MADSIRCPSCKGEIPLSEVISHQIEEQLAARLARELAAQEQQLRRGFEQTQAARETELARRAEERAEERVATQLAALGSQLAEQDARLREARGRELELLKEKRLFDEEKEQLALELARQLDEERAAIAAEARRTAAEEHQLLLREKELQVEQMKRQIRDLQESSQQTRAGLLGEAQEREIEAVLREKFRADRIEPVKSGVRGADVLQSVYSSRGELCGRILWESKRARNWSNGWVSKLKDDQAQAGADAAVLVCSALPGDVRHMELVDGVWVVGFPYATCIAQALRAGLIGIARAKAIDANRNTSLHELYDYLTSNEFNRRVRTMVESFIEMKSDLDSERRSLERAWTKRAKQLDALELNTAGLYGELEALVGTALPPIDTLELPAPVLPLRSAG